MHLTACVSTSTSESVVVGFTTFCLHFCFVLTMIGKAPIDETSPSTLPDVTECVPYGTKRHDAGDG
jgi:hypothetical protein